MEKVSLDEGKARKRLIYEIDLVNNEKMHQ